MAYTAPYAWDLPAATAATLGVSRRGVRGLIDHGLIQRRQTLSSESVQGQAAVRSFKLTFALAPRSVFNKALALWEKTNGGAQGISYTNTDFSYASAETLVVRIVTAPSLSATTADDVFFNFTIELEEMLHSPGT